MKKTLLIISTMVFVVLSIIACVLYKERVLYVDSAYFAFNLINNEMPVVEHNRYAFYLLQILPWVMLKSGFSISIILKAYSMSHILVGFAAFIILLKIKQPKAALLLTLFQVLTYRESFFLALNETSILIASVFLLGGFLNYYETKTKRNIQTFTVYFSCLLLAIFSHPMAFLLCPFVVILHFLDRTTIHKKQLLLIIYAGILSVLIKFMISKTSSYESDLYVQLIQSFELLGDIRHLNSFFFFFGNFDLKAYIFTIYFIPIALMFFISYHYYHDKKYQSFSFYLSFVIFFWQIIIVIFNRGDGNIFMEKNFTPWVFVCLYPLVYLPIRPLKIHVVVYLCIAIFSFWGIYKVSTIYINRFKVLNQLISEQNSQHEPKLLIQDSTIDHTVWQATWALPYETLLLCKIKGLPNTTAKVYHNEVSINKELYRTDIFLGADFFPVFPAKRVLNQRYFKLEEVPYWEVDIK